MASDISNSVRGSITPLAAYPLINCRIGGISRIKALRTVSRLPGSGKRLTVRKALMRDIPPILQLINGYAAKGVMLPRTEFEMSEAIRDFTVVYLDDRFLGCGALHFYSPTIAEIRSLAVHEDAKTHGVGRKLIEALAA